MTNKAILATIKSTVKSYLPDAKVLLFGSRARGDEKDGSDFDLLIITPKTFTPREKISWCSLLDKALVKSIHAPVDVLFNSQDEVNVKKDLPGHIISWAMKEGVAL